MNWFDFSIADIFTLQQSPLETMLRGSLVYLSLFLLLRFGLRRESGVVGMTDLLVVVLIAEAAASAFGADVTSLPDCVLLVATIIFWAYALDWLGYRFPAIARLVRPPPLQLIRDGRMLRRNMRRELITEDELLSLLREHGVQEVAKIKEAYIEGDGQISVIKRDGDDDGVAEDRRTTAL